MKIKFSSPDAQATFQCAVDKKPFAACRSPFKTPKLKPGKHRVQIRATDQVGNADPTPALVNVTIKRKRR